MYCSLHLDLTLKSTIQLGTCNRKDRQIWIYNSQDQTLRPTLDQNMCLDVGSTGSCSVHPWNTYSYCNYKLNVETRVKDLLPRMTLAEKVQIYCWESSIRHFVYFRLV